MASVGRRAASRRVPILAVEAIIGAGKSTLLELVRQRFGSSVVVVPEPVDVWTNVDGAGGQNLLAEYYKDQKRWGFSFQAFACFSRVHAVRGALAETRARAEAGGRLPRAIVMERSWFSDRECFASLLADSGALAPLEQALYRRLFEWEEGGWPKVDGFVYLEVDVEVAQQRVAERGRVEESEIPHAYQTELHAKHTRWIESMEKRAAAAAAAAAADAAAVDAAGAVEGGGNPGALVVSAAPPPGSGEPEDDEEQEEDSEDEGIFSQSPSGVADALAGPDQQGLGPKGAETTRAADARPRSESESESGNGAVTAVPCWVTPGCGRAPPPPPPQRQNTRPRPCPAAPFVLRLDANQDKSAEGVAEGWLDEIDRYINFVTADSAQ